LERFGFQIPGTVVAAGVLHPGDVDEKHDLIQEAGILGTKLVTA